MSDLFSPTELRSVKIANRIVVSPMCQYAAHDGSANDWHLMHLGQYAMGAAGLLMTEATHVSAKGRITPKCLGLYSDANEQELDRVLKFCRQYGVVNLGIQIAHAGRKASTQPPLDGRGYIDQKDGGWQTQAPSDLAYDTFAVPVALDEAGLEAVKQDFVASTQRAVRLGFDVYELHAAHGYLLHQFLSPLSNQRTDSYGGSLENRMRYPLEVFDAVRAVIPDDKPLGVRVSATDWVNEGWDLEQTITFAKALKARECDFIDVSSGGLDPRQSINTGPGYQVEFAQQIRQESGLHCWAVGMITEAAQAQAIIADGQADMVALARALMYNPRWAWHAAEELGAETAYAAQYARCHPSTWPDVFATRNKDGSFIKS